jgi:hypothetical protein
MTHPRSLRQVPARLLTSSAPATWGAEAKETEQPKETDEPKIGDPVTDGPLTVHRQERTVRRPGSATPT